MYVKAFSKALACCQVHLQRNSDMASDPGAYRVHACMRSAIQPWRGDRRERKKQHNEWNRYAVTFMCGHDINYHELGDCSAFPPIVL